MKFSILVAAYNAQHYLPQCLDSLFAQTEKSVQVIVIDDCSTDDSLQVEQQYTKVRDNCVLVLHNPHNKGQAEARNLGLQYAVGELTMMVDADDWLAPDCLERIWEAYQQAPDIDAVTMRLMLQSDDGTVTEWNDPSALPLVMSGQEACDLTLSHRLHGLYAVRTSIHKEHPFDTSSRLYSDDNTTYIHYLNSRRVARSEGIYYYRQHDASTTHQKGMSRLMFLKANISLRQQLETHHCPAATLSLCERHCWLNFQGIYRQMMLLRQSEVLTPDQEEEINDTLREAFYALRLDRLGISRPPYALFRFKQWAISMTKRLIGRS